jgi:hypothetical protein
MDEGNELHTHKTLLRCAALGLLAMACLLTTGCSRAVITTTVKPDGAFTRKIVFHGPSAGDKAGAGIPMPGGELKDSFDMPSGGPWKTKSEKLENEQVYTAERELTPGSVQKQDLAIKSGDPMKPGVFMVNEASVRSVGPGKWEYRETLHWNGKLPDMMAMITPDGLQIVKAGLPPALATDANVRPIAVALTRAVWRAMFGPGDPLISSWSQFMMQPETVSRKMQAMASPALDKAIAAQLGDKLSPQERRACVRKIIENITNGLTQKTAAGADPTKASAKPDFGDAALAALTFSVKLPGKIVSTNGERDDFNREVYWFVYPQAAVLGDVEMTAICDTKAQ